MSHDSLESLMNRQHEHNPNRGDGQLDVDAGEGDSRITGGSAAFSSDKYVAASMTIGNGRCACERRHLRVNVFLVAGVNGGGSRYVVAH